MSTDVEHAALDPELERKLIARVRERREDLVELTRALVAHQSVLGDEAGVQLFVERRLRDGGFTTERVMPDANAALADPTAGYPYMPYSDQRSTVVGHLSGLGGGRSMHLSGHVDVVPVERPDLWVHDPWAGEIADGRMYGRGAGDMKGGVAACLVAAEVVAECCPHRRGEILVSTVIEEECTGNGMWSLLRAGHVGDAILVGECTGMVYVHAATGVVWCRVVARGGSGHSMLATGEGAFDQLAHAIGALRTVESEINDTAGDPDFVAARSRPYGMTVGKIEGGVWTASTPYELAAYVRFGFGPETTPQEIQRRMRNAVKDVAPAVDLQFEGFRAEAHNHSKQGPLADVLRDAHQLVVGESLAPVVNLGTVDTRYVKQVPGFCYGPIAGEIHGTDEWLDLDSQLQVATVIALATACWTA